jgi:hypothetical protein
MGRLKKYNTEDEKKQAVREASKKYYWANKELIDKKRRDKYGIRIQTCAARQ